jgi:hypothetical protein
MEKKKSKFKKKTANNIKSFQQIASMEDLNYLLIKFSNSSQFYNKMTSKREAAGQGMEGLCIILTFNARRNHTCKTAMLVPMLQNTDLNQEQGHKRFLAF